MGDAMNVKERELFTQALNLITELDKEGLVLEMGLILEMREALAQPEQEPVAFVKKLNAMIIGCVDVINEDGVHEDAKKLAKLVKKDCYEILRSLEEEKNGAL